MHRLSSAAVAAILAATTLTACGGSQPGPKPPAATVTVTNTTGLPHGYIDGQDRVFLADLQGTDEWAGYFSTVPRDILIETGHSVCTGLARDGKVATLQMTLDKGMTLARAAFLLHASAMAYCPDQLSGVQ